jgi:hypothetical protein
MGFDGFGGGGTVLMVKRSLLGGLGTLAAVSRLTLEAIMSIQRKQKTSTNLVLIFMGRLAGLLEAIGAAAATSERSGVSEVGAASPIDRSIS